MSKRKKIVSADYDDGKDRFLATPDAMTFWTIEPQTVAASACPDAWRAHADNKDVAKAHRTVEKRLTVANGTVASTGAIGCRATQADME